MPGAVPCTTPVGPFATVAMVADGDTGQVNLNAVGWVRWANGVVTIPLLSFKGGKAAGQPVAVTTLKAAGYSYQSDFEVLTGTAAVAADGSVVFTVPPFSVLHATIKGYM